MMENNCSDPLSIASKAEGSLGLNWQWPLSGGRREGKQNCQNY